ncbi:MYG1 family protein [Candidatus Kaiserbacteria bacterium]|nr:MYG1 family protein [Candidatus Kaiserbacteria bacterium]
MIKVVTHSGGFHGDDVFAVAAFQLLLGKESVAVVRTRDEAVIADGDYVVDVGGVYDAAHCRFDHHQPGAPVRENGIPYAGFGLMWKHYGEEICGSAEIAEHIEQQLCQPIDAGDNGVSLYTLNDLKVAPFELYNFVSLFAPPWGSGESKDEAFLEAVDWARSVLGRMIEKGNAALKMKALVAATYEAAEQKAQLMFEVPVPAVALIEYADVALVICPDDPQSNNNWTATCVRTSYDSFETRVSFPSEWAGLRTEELAAMSGIPDAVFCHKARFIFVAGSKESVVAAARMAK